MKINKLIVFKSIAICIIFILGLFIIIGVIPQIVKETGQDKIYSQQSSEQFCKNNKLYYDLINNPQPLLDKNGKQRECEIKIID